MNPDTVKNLIQSIGEALTPLADKIGKGGQYMFELAIRQVYVNAVQSILVLVVLSILLIPFYKFIKWGNSKEKDCSSTHFYYNEALHATAWTMGIILGCLFVITIICFINNVSALFNPQWEAIQIIFRAITPVK